MIFKPVILSTRDINGPNARKYSERDTIYASPSGKDGYLGHTPELPIRSLGKVSELLTKIKSLPTTVNLLSGEYVDRLTITESSSGRPITIIGNGSKIIDNTLDVYYPTLSCDRYVKYDIPTSNYINSGFHPNMFVGDFHLRPVSFPRKGAYYSSYTILNSNKSVWMDDDSGFLSAISKVYDSVGGTSTKTYVMYGTPFYSSGPGFTGLSSITLSSGDRYVLNFTSSLGANSISLIPFFPYPTLDFSSIIDEIEIYEGEYFLSKESEDFISVYCKPFHSSSDQILKFRGFDNYYSQITPIQIENVRDVNIFDLEIFYGNNNLKMLNVSSVSITGCKFSNSKQTASYLQSTTNLLFSKNLITSSGWCGLEVRHLSSMNIEDNIFYGIGLDGTGEGYSNAIYSGIPGSDYSKSVRNLNIRNNIFKYNGGGTLDLNFANVINVNDNLIENTGFGFSEDMGALRTGASGPGILSGNLIRNVRQHASSRNGMGLYIDGQCSSLSAHNNIIDNAGTPFLSNEPSRHHVYNNIFMGGKGPNSPLQLQFTTSSDNLYGVGNHPEYHALSAYRNIHIASESLLSKYLKRYITYTYRPSENFFSLDSINPALRITHNFISSNPDDHKIFTISGKDSNGNNSGFGSGANFYYMRAGEYGGRPIYTTGNNYRLMVQDGNWTQILWNYYTTPIPTLSTSCGVDGYNYPWEVPSSEWKNVSNGSSADLTFSFSSYTWKRTVPWYSQDNNCFYTELDVSSNSLTLSTDSYAFRGRSQRDINKVHINSDYENVSFVETISSANNPNVLPLSSSFESISPWNPNSIFADPMIDRSDYQVKNRKVLDSIGFSNIDMSNVGTTTNPYLSTYQNLKFHPTYGSLDWSEFLYANHNDLPIQETIISSITSLRNYKYYFDSPLLVNGIGKFIWDKSSDLIDDGLNVVIPNNWEGKLGRWRLLIELLDEDGVSLLQEDSSSIYIDI